MRKTGGVGIGHPPDDVDVHQEINNRGIYYQCIQTTFIEERLRFFPHLVSGLKEVEKCQEGSSYYVMGGNDSVFCIFVFRTESEKKDLA